MNCVISFNKLVDVEQLFTCMTIVYQQKLTLLNLSY